MPRVDPVARRTDHHRGLLRSRRRPRSPSGGDDRARFYETFAGIAINDVPGCPGAAHRRRDRGPWRAPVRRAGTSRLPTFVRGPCEEWRPGSKAEDVGFWICDVCRASEGQGVPGPRCNLTKITWGKPSRGKSPGVESSRGKSCGEVFPVVDSSERVPIEPQSIITPLSRAAVFLVLCIGNTPEAVQRVRSVIADIGGLVRAVGFRDLQGRLSCNVAIGSAAWDRLGQSRRPAQLRPFAEIRGPCTSPWRRRGICCSTSGQIAPTCVLKSSGSFSRPWATP